MSIKYGKGDAVVQAIIMSVIVLICVVCLYPLLYVLSSALSDSVEMAKNPVLLLPRGFSLNAMGMLFEKPEIWRSYYNTLWYTIVGTLINLFMTVLLAYPLARPDFGGRKLITRMVTFTMLFGPGLIPMYMLVNNVGLYGTRWALVIPGAISVFNMILARTFFMGLPDSLVESAKLDGANDLVILVMIILPLSKAILATLVMYYAVGHWNSYLNALLYLPDSKLHPLQMFLVKIVIQNDPTLYAGMEDSVDRMFIADQLKFATIVAASLPILCIYPFFQKHFAKGVMVGSLKG